MGASTKRGGNYYSKVRACRGTWCKRREGEGYRTAVRRAAAGIFQRGLCRVIGGRHRGIGFFSVCGIRHGSGIDDFSSCNGRARVGRGAQGYRKIRRIADDKVSIPAAEEVHCNLYEFAADNIGVDKRGYVHRRVCVARINSNVFAVNGGNGVGAGIAQCIHFVRDDAGIVALDSELPFGNRYRAV